MIDTAERIFAAFDIIDELTKEQGLVTSETLPAMRATSGHSQNPDRMPRLTIAGSGKVPPMSGGALPQAVSLPRRDGCLGYGH